MANQQHIDLIKQGVEVWNEWREKHYDLVPDLVHTDLSWRNLSRANFCQTNLDWTNLSHAQLENADLRYAGLIRTNFQEANLSGTDLSKAVLQGAFLQEASLKKVILNEANIKEANLSGADLSEAFLIDANLYGAILFKTNLSQAKLTGAILCGANFVETNLTAATLTNCYVYGISVWKAQLQDTTQNNLVITPTNESTITVDNLEVAQFIYLLLNNPKIRDVIDTIGKKAVLILGRFTPERKVVLEAIRDVLRAQGYLPILFDFPKPDSQDLTGTVSTLANLSRFIIADLTDPSCSPYEIGLIAPYMKPIKPLFQPSEAARREFAMFRDLRKRYAWVLPVYRYKDHKTLLTSFQEKVIAPAEQRVLMLETKKRR